MHCNRARREASLDNQLDGAQEWHHPALPPPDHHGAGLVAIPRGVAVVKEFARERNGRQHQAGRRSWLPWCPDAAPCTMMSIRVAGRVMLLPKGMVGPEGVVLTAIPAS